MKTFKIKEQKIIFNYLKQNIRSLSLDRYDQCFQKNLQLTASFTAFFWGWMGEGERSFSVPRETLPKEYLSESDYFFNKHLIKKNEWKNSKQLESKFD